MATPRRLKPLGPATKGLAPLRYPSYALFWVGHTFSHVGRWIDVTGSIWVVYQLTGSPILLGLLGVCRAVPAIALSSIAGVIVDRVDQRRLLAITQAIAAVSSLSIGILLLTGSIQFWHVYVEVVVQSAVNAFDASARQSLFPRLVARADLPEAVTLYTTGARLAQLVGTAVAGFVIGAWGVAAPFLLSGGMFAVLIVAVAWIRVLPELASPRSSIRGELAEGLRYLTSAPILMSLVKMEVFFGLFQMNPVMITLAGHELLGVDPQGLGLLLSAPALGSLAAIALLLTLRQTRRQGRLVILCTLGYAALLVLFANARVYTLAFATLVMLGALDMVITTTRQGVLQLAAPAHMRGRVLGNVGMVTRGVRPLAQTQSGFLAGSIGAPFAIVLAAVTLGAAAAANARSNPGLWQFNRDAVVLSNPLPFKSPDE